MLYFSVTDFCLQKYQLSKRLIHIRLKFIIFSLAFATVMSELALWVVTRNHGAMHGGKLGRQKLSMNNVREARKKMKTKKRSLLYFNC